MKLKDKQKNYLVSAFFSIFWIGFICLVWRKSIPFEIFQFWIPKGNPLIWMQAAWPIFAWGFAIQTILEIYKKKNLLSYLPQSYYREFWRPFAHGAVVSLRVGVLEEIAFRWLIFLGAIPTARIFNWLLGGFIFDAGLLEIIHNYILGPIANFVTLGYLKEYLFHSVSWSVGAALLGTNAFFRNGHKYHGLIGIINSWFLGMFFFGMLFKFGLISAIAIHITYNLIIDFVMALWCKLKK